MPKLKACYDLISQAELQKGAELMEGGSAGSRIVGTLYMSALARRVAGGAAIQPGLLAFDPGSNTISKRRPASSETIGSHLVRRAGT